MTYLSYLQTQTQDVYDVSTVLRVTTDRNQLVSLFPLPRIGGHTDKLASPANTFYCARYKYIVYTKS